MVSSCTKVWRFQVINAWESIDEWRRQIFMPNWSNVWHPCLESSDKTTWLPKQCCFAWTLCEFEYPFYHIFNWGPLNASDSSTSHQRSLAVTCSSQYSTTWHEIDTTTTSSIRTAAAAAATTTTTTATKKNKKRNPTLILALIPRILTQACTNCMPIVPTVPWNSALWLHTRKGHQSHQQVPCRHSAIESRRGFKGEFC